MVLVEGNRSCKCLPYLIHDVKMPDKFDCAGCGAVVDYNPDIFETLQSLDWAWENSFGPLVEMVLEAKKA